jgi:FkbM family methyltransferase
MSIRTRFIQFYIHVNELLFFYPKLRKYYRLALKKNRLNVIDVGANKGQTIDFFLGITPNVTVWAFEPNKKLANNLIQKYRERQNIHIFNCGVSEFSGELLFKENIMDETSTFETLNFESKYLEKKAKYLGVKKNELVVDSYYVNVVSLGEFLETVNHKNGIDVIKIDVEGHELYCLKGLFNNPKVKNKIKFIQIENHHDDMYLNSQNQEVIDELIRKNGFKLDKKIRHGFGDFSELIYKNIHFNDDEA